MKRYTLKKILPSILLICALSLTTIYIDGAQNDADDAKEQIDNLQDQMEDVEDEIDKYNQQEEALQNDLNDLNSNLQSLATDMNDLETQIASKQAEIETITVELEEATQIAAEQYEDMKSRIQFMYEYGNTSLLVTLLESNSFSDFLNKAEYVSYIASYDRTKLNEYQQLLTDITQKKETLEAEETSLLALKEEMQQKQSTVTQLISATQSNIDKTQTQLANANENLASLEEQLEYWEAYEKELEAQKAQEDLKNWENIQDMEQEDWSGVDYVPQEGEAYLLAAIIQCEAEGEPYEGKLAVGSVIMNRVKSSSFPNTITGVVYQKNQFSPVASGRLAYRLEAGVNDECKRAATEILNGTNTINALFFRMNNGTIQGTIIGNHVFY